MRELQAHLGDLNDLATAPGVLARLGLPAGPETPHDRDRLIDASARALDKLVDRTPFWR
jgi:CHAD domain-containing protein